MDDQAQQPLTIGVAITALHVLHIAEYCATHGIELDRLYASDIRTAPRTLRWIRSTCRVLELPEPTVTRFVLNPQESSVEDDLAVVERSLAGHAGPIRIVSGGFHLPFLWFLVERYADRLTELILVDEGAGTYASRIGNRNLRPWILNTVHEPALASAYQCFRDTPATFVSRYPLKEQLRPGDTLERVDRSVLPALLRVGETAPSQAVYFIGSPLQLILDKADADVELTSLAVLLTKRLHPGAEVVYIPHRDEVPEKLDRLGRLVEVRMLDHPIELEGLVTGTVPKRFATFSSSGALSWAMLDPEVRVDLFPLADDLMQPRYVEANRAGRDLFDQLIGSQLTSHSLDLSSWPAPAPPGPADVTVVLGSDGEARMQTPEVALDEALALIRFARAIDPARRMLYVAARGESTTKLHRLADEAEVEDAALPVELLPEAWGFWPRDVVTVRATGLASLVGAGRATGWVLVPPESGYFLEAEAVAAAHEQLRTLPAEVVRFEELTPERETVEQAQQRHTRLAAEQGERIAELEQELAEALSLAAKRHGTIGSTLRKLEAQKRKREELAATVKALRAELEAVRRPLDRLRAPAARLRAAVGRRRR